MIALIFWIGLCVSFGDAAERIVSLSPALTEVVYAVHRENELVGVSEYSDYPPEAKSKPVVGPYTKPLFEKILALKPTLILVPKEGPKEVLDHLRLLKFNFEVIPTSHVGDVADAIRTIGKSPAADALAAEWLKNMKSLKQTSKPAQVLIQVGHEPLIVAGRDTFLNEVLELCGATNVFRHLSGYSKVPMEKLMGISASHVVILVHGSEKQGPQSFWKKWKAFEKTKIVQLDEDLLARPGPRLLEGGRQLCQALD